ncbi:tyrosine-protein phosphatase [Nocardia sp. alder85J]|uniref:tyrosine-protein phosphatase n=1 Tax=Nocardia sp. alder85J TaxID=2862949 RepID=UPI001CD7E832|nr:tyrosine-protein phosphatase [Nocardia sp. alder85J]MCX4094794.1 tyrosine-protein phosphatase [Nocardia sp. alder85J]
MTRHRLFGAALVLTATVSSGAGLLAPTMAAAAEPPAATGSVLSGVDDRSLHLEGVLNARDLGGYRTTDGRVVRTGLVYRTGELGKATDADLAALTGHDVRVVDDLRTSFERTASADRVPAGATANWDDIIGGNPVEMLKSFSAGPDLYRAFITEPAANVGFANVLHDIANTDAAVLYHCSAGKDRTGWTSAVLLTLLGVDRDTVNYDFLLSNFYRDAPTGDMVNGVAQPELDAAFDQVGKSYGSFDNYLHEGLKLTDGDIAVLRAKLLH